MKRRHLAVVVAAAWLVVIGVGLWFARERKPAPKPVSPRPESRTYGIETLRNPPTLLVGVYDSRFPADMSSLLDLEQQLHSHFPIVSLKTTWGDKPDSQFPAPVVDEIDQLGSVPMITWQPFVTNFDPRSRAEGDYAALAAIARGEYDFYVVPWARAAARFRKPIFLRFAHEMNDPYGYDWGPQNGNEPADFINAWRRIHDLFVRLGATNVLWIWSPDIAMPGFDKYYPGGGYVDWVGLKVLNHGTAASWSRWWNFADIAGSAYPALAKFGKPIIVCELGSVAQGGDLAEWYRRTFYDLDHRYGRVRAVILFNQRDDELNWIVTQDPRATEAVAKELTRLR